MLLLGDEIRLLQHALKEEKPILGVCLGSQLLAAALGAAVTKGKRKEIGWHPITLTKAAAGDELWHGQDAKFTAFHWHGDVFDLPRGAVSLARSELTECQAFRCGASAYGILFHLEVTEPIVRHMAKAFRQELVETGINEHHLLERLPARLESLRQIGWKVFGRWAQLAFGSGRP